MALRRFPFRDPRTVARDIPGLLDVLFPRLAGGLVASLNRRMFTFEKIVPVPDALVEKVICKGRCCLSYLWLEPKSYWTVRVSRVGMTV